MSHFLCSLSYYSSIVAFSNVRSPQSAILCFHCLLITLSSSISCLHLLPCLSISSHFFNHTFLRASPVQYVTNPVSFPSFYCMQEVCFLLGCMQYFLIFRMISPAGHFQHSTIPHFKTFNIFLICFLKGASFSTKQSYAPSVALHQFLY